MNYNDHDPPHFHARYQESQVYIEIANGRVHGAMPARALRLVQEWMRSHQDELMADWERARQRQPLEPIPPLD